MGAEIVPVNPFDALGASLRFGVTADGIPFVVGSDFAARLGYRSASDAARLLDEDEKGTQIVRTPGGDQQVLVFFEDGIWELIFRSGKPEAKAIKKRVKEILAQLRRGELVPAQRTESMVPDLRTPEGVLAMADLFQQTARRLVASEARVAELEPVAESWEHLVDATGDYSLRDAAQILSRDPDIEIGQKRLAKLLRELGWVDKKTMRPYQTQVANDRLSARVSVFTDDEGERHTKYQARVRPKGLHALRGHLSGVKPLQLRLALIDGSGEAS